MRPTSFRLTLASICLFISISAFAGTPVVTTTPPVDGFVGEQFCFDAELTNSNAGEPGYSPYYRLILVEDLTLSAATFVGAAIPITNEGTFAAPPSNTLTDSVSGDDVTGPENAILYTLEYPIGSVTSGSPPLAMKLCIDVNPASTIDVQQSGAIAITPAFALGDTPTGENGAQTGAEQGFPYTPRVITYTLDDETPEGERPPGPAWSWDIEACANIASDRTVTPIDFASIELIVLPSNVQFQGPFSFTGTGVDCSAVTTPADLTAAPGGSIDLNCTSGQGILGNGDADEICVTFPVYITNTLDPTSCGNDSAINEAEHVSIQKGSSGGRIPGAVRGYSVAIQVSEFVPGVSRLEITDVLPDGVTFADDASVDFGAGSVALSGALRTIDVDTPTAGETTVTFFITNGTGTLPSASGGTLTYSASIDQSYSLTSSPVLARDELTNMLVGEYDIDGAGNATNCQDTSQASFTIQDVTTEKGLVAPGGEVQPGDIVTFSLRMVIPSGDVDDIVFEDYFPLPVFDATLINTNTDIATNPDIRYTTNDTLNLTPISITANGGDNSVSIQWPDVSTTSQQIIEIEIDAVVSNAPFADNLGLSNVFQALTDNTPADNSTSLKTVAIMVRSPDLSIVKAVTSADSDLEPGDTVTYDITVTNDSVAEAYDVIVIDNEPAGLTSCTLTGVNGGAGGGGDSPFDADGFVFTSFDAPTANALDGGASATVSVSCTVDVSATPNQTITNTASTTWASAPGAMAFPGVETTVDVTTATAEQPSKSIVATSESATPETAPRPVAQGEIVRFRMSAQVPEGTLNNVDLIDLIPAGLRFVDDGTATIAFVTTSGGGALSSNTFTQANCGAGTLEQTGALAAITPSCTLPVFGTTFNSGTDVTLNVGTVVNNETDADDEFILIELNAVGLGNRPNGTTDNNRFRLDSTEVTVTSPQVEVSYVLPEVETTKSATPASVDAGDTVTYTITVDHGDDSLADGFDLTFTDTLDGTRLENFNFVSGPIAPGGETCTAVGASVDSSDPFGAGISITFDALPLGEVCQIQYTATVRASVVPGDSIDNTANVAFDTLAGTGDPGNTTGSPQETQGSFSNNDMASVDVTATMSTKRIDSTSFAHTDDGPAGTADANARPVSIGETIRYRIEVQMPEGNAPDFIITDQLPSGLRYETGTARLAFLAEGAGITPTPPIVCLNGGTLAFTGDENDLGTTEPECQIAASGGPFGSGTDPVFDLGDVMNDDMDADQEFVILEFDAIVLNETVNQQGVSLDNTFEVSIDGSPRGTTTTAFTEVIEPQVQCALVITPNPVDNRTDATPTVSLSYTLTNNGLASAFQTGAPGGLPLVLDLPAGFENITGLGATPTGNVFLNNTATPVTAGAFAIGGTDNRVLTASSTLQFDASASLAIEFDANLQASVEPGDFLADICIVTYRSQSSGGTADNVRDATDLGNGSGNDPIGGTGTLNDYRDEAAILLTTLAEDPEIGLAKDVSAGPTSDGNGNYLLTYLLTVENSGTVGLDTAQIVEDLATTFSGATFTVNDVTVTSDSGTLTENAAFTGTAPNTSLLDAAASTLPVGDTGTVAVEITVTPGSNFGPYNNTATTSAQSDRTNAAVNDTSDDGLVPDGDSDGDPTNDSDVTPVSFSEAPELGLAKNLSDGPDSNADGTYSLQYTLVVENSGDIALSQVQIVENLGVVFADADSFTIDNVTSADLTLDGGYTGIAPNTNLLDGTDTLAASSSASVIIDITVSPGDDLGPYDNTASVSGTSPGGAMLTDISDNGTDPDGDGNGDPTNDSDVTPVSFSEMPQFGLAKQLSVPPSNNGDGTYSFQYQFAVENSGDIALTQVQVVDDLATVFTNATGFTVDNLSSTDFTVSGTFTGIAPNTNLLDGTDTLAANTNGTITLDITVEPGGDLGPYDNTASANADSPAGTMLSDVSDNGTDPDGDGNGDPTNDSDVTPVSFVEGPRVGLAKQITAGPTTNPDGTYTLTYTFVLENAGDIELNDLEIIDTLGTTFAAAQSFTIDSLTSADFVLNQPGFDGTVGNDNLLGAGNTLGVGESGSVALTITITPGAALGQFDNIATANGVSPASVAVTDVSDNGADPDGDNDSNPNNDSDSTPVTLSETAIIGIAKAVSSAPINNADGTYTLSYEFVVENSGDVTLSDVQVTDDLAATFPGTTFTIDALTSSDFSVNQPGFDGIGDSNLLAAGVPLAPATLGRIALTVTVTPGANLGTFNNTAEVQGTSPSGANPMDTSVDGVDPDANNDNDPTNDTSPTPVTFNENAVIGVAKTISAAPVNNADGTYTLSYAFVVENFGDVSLSDVQVVDDLATTFAGSSFTVDALTSADLTVNQAGFNGSSDTNLLAAGNTLTPGETGNINLTITVTPGTNLGPYNNSATSTGTAPSGAMPSDNSVDATDPDANGNDDPTDDASPATLTFEENPQIGLAKTVSSGPQNLGDGRYRMTYAFVVQNGGDIALSNVQINEPLATTFAGANYVVETLTSAELAVNAAGFDGNANANLLAAAQTLDAGMSATIELTLVVTPGTALGPYDNLAVVNSTSPAGTPVVDTSTDGSIPDANGDGDPTNDSVASSTTFAENPVLGVAKAATEAEPNFDSTFTTQITLVVENLGDIALANMQIDEPLALNFAPAQITSIDNVVISGDLSATNAAFDGVNTTSLLAGTEMLAVGGTATVLFDVTVNLDTGAGCAAVPWTNSVVASASSPGGTQVSDASTPGDDPDPDGDGNPANNDAPTDVSVRTGVDGVLSVPVEVLPGDPLNLSVADADMNLDDAAIDTLVVTVDNLTNGESEQVTLTETGAASGVFEGALATQQGEAAGANNDGTLTLVFDDSYRVSYTDTLTNAGCVEERIAEGRATGFATLQGNAWLDGDTNDAFDAGEAPLEGWVIEVRDADGNLVATVSVAADGSYTVPELIPNPGYSITLKHPGSGTVFGVLDDIDLPPDTVVLEQNLPIDPSGVFYDSVERTPVQGVMVQLVTTDGTPLPAACLLANQQPQTTAADGYYRFDLIPDADPLCPPGDTYFIDFVVPGDFQEGLSDLIPPLPDPIDPTGLGNPVRVGDTATAPTEGQSTDYYTGFTLDFGDPDVIYNHVPLDPVGVERSSVRLIKRVERPTTTVGSLIAYTISIENVSPVTLPAIDVEDMTPAGLSYVEGSALLDGQSTGFTAAGPRPLRFSGIRLEANQQRVLRYLLRVGAGVTQGTYRNTAAPTLNGFPIGNEDSAEVEVIADPDFEETTIIGKVWHDRDGDGWQDRADATGLVLSGGPFGSGKSLDDLLGRRSAGDNLELHQVVFTVPMSDDPIKLVSNEGSRITLKGVDRLENDATGDVKRGRNAQHLTIVREFIDSPKEVERTVTSTRTVTVDHDVAPVRFDSGRSVIPDEYIAQLRTVLDGLINKTNVRVHFVGHTDNKPLGDKVLAIYGTNQGLSESRADTVAHQFREALSLDAAAVMTSGRADTQPLATNATLEGRALNRRVEIEITFDDVTIDEKVVRTTTTQASDLMRVVVTNHGIHEEGIAGVRLATVEGLVIESDSKGRYHIAGVDGGFFERGRNFIVKVDPASLPQNSTFTTENPRVKRITQGLMNQFDFGVRIPELANVQNTARVFEFSSVFFTAGSDEIDARYSHLLTELSAALVDARGGRVVILGDEDMSLLRRRAMRVSQALRSTLPQNVWRNVEVTVMVPTASEARVHETPRESLLMRALGALFSVLSVTAHAAEPCTLDHCMQGDQSVVRVSGPEYSDKTDAASTGRFRVGLPGGGVIWASEDAVSITPRLAVAGPDTIVAGSAEPATFVAYTNYGGFIERLRLKIYAESDVDRVRPLAELKPFKEPKSFSDFVYFQWQPGQLRAALETRLAYVLEATDAAGRRDETSLGYIQLVGAEQQRELDDKAQKRWEKHVAENAVPPITVDSDSPLTPAQAHRLLSLTYGRTQLKRQNIVLHGARVRLQGADMNPDFALFVDGHRVPLDLDGKFAAEYLLPVGEHWVPLSVGSDDVGYWMKDLPVTVTGKQTFFVALADFTASSADLNGSIEPLAGNDRYGEESLVEGRLAYYLKARIKGKYLLTSQLDSREQQLDELLGSLDEKDTRSLFRRLDPDRYYPVYGDDSTTVADTNSLGRLYVRLEWNKSHVIWGNYQTSLDGNDFIQYRRTLYGAEARWRSVATTSRDDTRSELTVFGSETQTALGHSEFLGTGGSLYYLRHLDVIPGSEQARIEIRDADTRRTVESVPLVRGRDYEIDELQGRIILGKPLLQVAQQTAPALVRDGPLDGNQAILIVDYEYLPAGFDTDQVAAGARAKHWFGDYVAIGGTVVSEGRGSEDYKLAGADLTIAAGRGTYFKVEAARSEATQTERLFSTDGGLSFTQLNPISVNDRSGDAIAVEARANLQELGWTKGATTAAAWWRRTDDQFSIARRDEGVDTYESGLELTMELGLKTRIAARAARVEREAQIEETNISLQLDRGIGEKGTFSVEARKIAQEQFAAGTSVDATLVAVQYAHQVSDKTNVYAASQITLSNDEGQYDNNDQVRIGVNRQLTDRASVTAEASSGHRGDGATVTMNYDLSAAHTVYGVLGHSTDRSDRQGATPPGGRVDGFNDRNLLPGNTLALGHRSRISDQVDIFNEATLTDMQGPLSLGHVFGLNWRTPGGFGLSATLQHSDVDANQGIMNRTAYTLGGSYRSNGIDWSTRFEFRDDESLTGAADVTQWASINRLSVKMSEDYRFLARFNYADTEDSQDFSRDTRLVEGGLGLAYRPVETNRLNWLAKYTYLYDLTSLGQVNSFGQSNNRTDQRSHIASLEGIRRFGPRWSLGAKFARRESELRLDRSQGDWFDSTTSFAAIRLRYHLISNWDALAEYRFLDVDQAESTRKGWLVSVDRHVGEHMKVGIGYNFTDFSDDLTLLDFEYDGFFLNVIGKY